MTTYNGVNTDKLLGFFSYALVDRPIAREIVATLRTRNLKVWFDELDLDPTKDIDLQIWPTLLQSQYTIVLITKNSVSKGGYFLKERMIAEQCDQTTAMGSLLWGGNWRPPNQTVITGYRLVIYLVWDEVDFSTEGLQGDFEIIMRSPKHSDIYKQIECIIKLRAPFHNHTDVVLNFNAALSHQRLREIIQQVKTAEPFRQIVREKIEWPNHMAHQYAKLLTSKQTMLEPLAKDQFINEKIAFCRTQHDCFTQISDQMSKDLRIQTLNKFINDYSVCMEISNRFSFPAVDPDAICKVCKKKGTIFHYSVDLGGFTRSDYNENFIVICESCGYSWYDFEIDMYGNDWKVFDYETNTYVNHK